jgi:DEAD/DEAH box helicase domain protein
VLHYSGGCYQIFAIKTVIDESNLALRSPFFFDFFSSFHIFNKFIKKKKNLTVYADKTQSLIFYHAFQTFYQKLFFIMTTTFQDIGLSSKTLTALEKKGFKSPSPIQEKVIPLLLKSTQNII